MKNKFTLFLQVLMFAFFILFLNCQQPENEYKTKVERVIKCGIIFDKQSGTGGSDFVIATYGSAMPAAIAPARTYFIFTGYYDAVSGGVQYYNADMLSTRDWDKSEDAVLYAGWTGKQCTITFDKRSGTGGSDFVIVTYGSAMPAATAPAKTYFIFTGYYDAVSGGVQYYNADMSSARDWDKAEDTALYARWDWVTYNLRDTGPAGGLIFYINPNAETDGWKYLECAPSSTEWTSKQWGKYGTSVGGTGTAVGTGENNTALITAKLNEAPAESDRAAQLCDALIYGGFDDWFMPSKDELDLMYINLKQQGVGEFANGWYWSSSENNSNYARMQFLPNGEETTDKKSANYRVRAVRTF